MDLEWCLSCATRLPARPVQSLYCSTSCLRNSQQASTSAIPIDAYSSSSSSSLSDDAAEMQYASQWPGTSPSGIQAWRLGVPGARPEPHPYTERCASPTSAAAFALSTRNFARPELMRRHAPNQPSLPSTFVDKARHAQGKPTQPAPIAASPSPRATWAANSAQASVGSTASYITESAIATPASGARAPRTAGGLLYRVKSWVRAEGPSRAPSPAPAFVALPGMESTSTLVGELAAKDKAVALLDADDLPELADWRASRSPPGLRRAEFRAPRASRLALDAHPAYDSRGRTRMPARPPMFSPFGHAL